eukprot:2900649-Rhodomonas_salina.2
MPVRGPLLTERVVLPARRARGQTQSGAKSRWVFPRGPPREVCCALCDADVASASTKEKKEEAERRAEQAEQDLRAAQARARQVETPPAFISSQALACAQIWTPSFSQRLNISMETARKCAVTRVAGVVQAELDLATAEGERDRAVARAEGLEHGLSKAEADRQGEMLLRKQLAVEVEGVREAKERAEKVGREESAARIRAEEAVKHEEALRNVAEGEKQTAAARRDQVEIEMRSVRDELSKALELLEEARKNWLRTVTAKGTDWGCRQAQALERKKADRAEAEAAEEARMRKDAQDQQKHQVCAPGARATRQLHLLVRSFNTDSSRPAEAAKREAAARRIAEQDAVEASRREESTREAVQRAEHRAVRLLLVRNDDGRTVLAMIRVSIVWSSCRFDYYDGGGENGGDGDVTSSTTAFMP